MVGGRVGQKKKELMQLREARTVAYGAINSQHRHRGSVTRSGSQISRLAPLVWDDEGSGEWDVGCCKAVRGA